jgi:hypothetical protein
MFFALLLVSSLAIGQSKTTEVLSKKYTDSQAFFFYHNTIAMLNQNDDKEFDELIKDIEKVKVLVISKGSNFKNGDYKKLTADYKTEAFEEMMTSRYDGKNFDIYMKDKAGKTKGMIVLVNDSSKLYVLDVVGSIALNKITTLYSTLTKNSEITKRLKSFTDHNKNDSDHSH